MLSDLLFHLEAASAYAEEVRLSDIQDDIDALIRRLRKDDPGDDSGWTPPVPQGHSGAMAN